MDVDWHTHTTYSDGSAMAEMIAAAERAGLDALGLTDHCVAFEDDFGRRERYDLVETYERRRADIEARRPETDLTLYDAAEVSYAAGTEAATASFLDDAAFDYVIGSVHFAGAYDYTSGGDYADASDATRRAAVERYYDAVVAAAESELFDVLGHIDLPERHPHLRGYSERRDYERVAAALADSRTVPEINAGRLFGSLERVHPRPETFAVFAERDVGFVLGTDSHAPGELERRVPGLRSAVETADVAIRAPRDVIGSRAR